MTPFSIILQEFGDTGTTPVPLPVGGDPFTLVYEALWYMLLQNPNFQSGVKERNRVTFVPAEDRSVNKQFLDSKLSADYPEIRLIAEGTNPSIIHDSSSTKITRTFAIVVSTNNTHLDEHLFPIEWEVVKAMANWRTNLSQLEWQGQKFIKRLASLPATTTMGVGSDNYPNGWASIWRVEVDMYFSTTQLATYA